ncbi:MAG: fumarylacetoacetate hydrolase family protein [Chloroflexota bacterium]
MRLATFAINGETRFGAQLDEQMIDLSGAYLSWCQQQPTATQPLPADEFPQDMRTFLTMGEPVKAAANSALAFASEAMDRLREAGLAWPLGSVTFLPPIQNPGKIICVGLNYRTHIQEMGRDLPKHPVIFAKFANTLIGHEAVIPYPTVSDTLDYEAELAFVIGQRAKDVPREKALDYVAGYTCFNDVSVREYQRRTIQFLQGKTFDGSGPCGPALVTADEIPDPSELEMFLRLNGETMQHTSLDDLVFDVPTLVELLSEIMTLEPGDIVATGTPGGVGFARDPKLFMKPGDRVEVEISNIGILRNTVGGM